MAPRIQTLHKKDNLNNGDGTVAKKPSIVESDMKIIWRNVIIFTLLHIAAIYGFYICLFKAFLVTNIYEIVMGHLAGLGVTAGAHRLWSHRSYRARLPLQIMLMFFNTMAMQLTVIDWSRNHRMHHKYLDTDADPHNLSRGFFFAHIGWMLVDRHSENKSKQKFVDMSDLVKNPLLKFQKRYYYILAPIACFLIPTYIPTLWGESLWNSFFVCVMLRYVYSLNAAWLVNSAHMWGNNRPYDKNIKPVDSKMVSILTLGEGFLNYHHTFAWDYKGAELRNIAYTNTTTVFINLMAKMGWAYDLQTVSDDVIHKRASTTGDGSYRIGLCHD